jgi:SAM-dependent methyltransferase
VARDLTRITVMSKPLNPFGLAGSINVAPGDDNVVYKGAEIDMCGQYALIDIQAEAHALPVEANSQDYVISSHVFEHLANPISALIEWRRVLKNGGVVFMIVPLRNALEADRSRPLSTFDEVWAAYKNGVTVDTWDYQANPVPGGRHGHYFVYTPELVKQMVEAVDGDWWELVGEEYPDQKVSNGFTLVWKLDKPAMDDLFCCF